MSAYNEENELKLTDGEVVVLDYIMKEIVRSGSPVMAQRHKEFPSLARKIIALKAQRNVKKEPAG